MYGGPHVHDDGLQGFGREDLEVRREAGLLAILADHLAIND